MHLTFVRFVQNISSISNAPVGLSLHDVVYILAIATVVDIEHFNERSGDLVSCWTSNLCKVGVHILGKCIYVRHIREDAYCFIAGRAPEGHDAGLWSFCLEVDPSKGTCNIKKGRDSFLWFTYEQFCHVITHFSEVIYPYDIRR